MRRPFHANVGLLLAVVVGCTSCAGFFYIREPTAGPENYVRAAKLALQRGDLGEATSILDRAESRFPEDPGVALWMVTVDELTGRSEAALSGLRDLSRGRLTDKEVPISPDELLGRTGMLLFQLGRWGESADYLSSGAVGPDKQGRLARSQLARMLPYVRQEPEFDKAVEVPLVEGALPEMVCRIGRKERAFVLDTGSSWTTITRSLAKELGVVEMVDFGLARDSLGRSFAAWLGVLPAFALGTVELGPQPVLIVEDYRIKLRDPLGGPRDSPEALVGLDILSRFQLTVDPDRKTVDIRKQPSQEVHDRLPVVHSHNCMLLPVKIENTRLWFILDTGASHTTLTDEGLAALPGGRARTTVDYRPIRTPAGRGIVVRAVPDLTIELGTIHFQVARLPVVSRPSRDLFPIHGVLGSDLLTRCQVTITAAGVTLRRRAAKGD